MSGPANWPSAVTDAAPVAFLPTTDAERARLFYAGVLGLRLVSDDEFALIFDLAGTMLRLVRVGAFTPQPFTVLGWEVADLDAAMRGLSRAGVAFERFDGIEQDELGAWAAPGGARIAWFKDPDGNLLSLSQHPPVP
jgi:catechol 2,3-dioxygenase-like lactoylglutathione lyase family enzyme